MRKTMYRRYTITGTNNDSSKVRKGLAVFFGLLLVLLIRFWFLCTGQMSVLDDYGYYQASMIQAGDMTPVFTSGAALAYSGSLSAILRFTGNRMDVIVYYHIVLQALSFCFLSSGYRSLFGKASALLQMLLFSLLPWMTVSIFKISPENFYLSAWSLVCMLLGLVSRMGEEKRGVGLPLLAGLGLGLVCGLHAMGLALFPVLLFSVRGRARKLVPALIGTISGIILALAGYQRILGFGLSDAAAWWGQGVLRQDSGRWQDLDLWLPVWLCSSLAAAILLKMILSGMRSRRAAKRAEGEAFMKEMDRKMEADKTKTAPEAGKKTNYIENPLPLPKKHVKRVMEFKLDEKDGFDIEIDEKDDFDI